ncbi:MAG: FAD:protein FMN transferase, partial [Candidatus Saccharimonadales bacterium]
MTVRRSSFDAIGTKWNIVVRETIATDVWEGLLLRIYERIQEFDEVYSRFRDDSLVHQMSLKAGAYTLPADGYKLLGFYEKLYGATNGKVTPLIGRAMSDAGYDAEYSFEHKQMQLPPKWEEAISYDEQSITLGRPVLLDFGAAGK